MGPRALRATSRKASSELPETSRANFLTAAAQLVSTTLPQLSTHLGQQALQYVDAQQVLLSSVTARSQLCKKCGSPLNPQTCSDVHVAWLSAATSERLSKRLAGSSSAAVRTRGSSSSKDKLVNRVVAVRRCMLCQEPSVRPFLSVHLAQQQLGREGFADVEVRGPDPLQQAEACRARRQAQRQQQEQQKAQQQQLQQGVDRDVPKQQQVPDTQNAVQPLQQQQQPRQQGQQQQAELQQQQPQQQQQQQQFANKRPLQTASEGDTGAAHMLRPAKRAAVDLQPAAATAAAGPDTDVALSDADAAVPQQQDCADVLGSTRLEAGCGVGLADEPAAAAAAAAAAVSQQPGSETEAGPQQQRQQQQSQVQVQDPSEPAQQQDLTEGLQVQHHQSGVQQQQQQEQQGEHQQQQQPDEVVATDASPAAAAAAVTAEADMYPLRGHLAADTTEGGVPAEPPAAAQLDPDPQMQEGCAQAAAAIDLPSAAAATTGQPAVPAAAESPAVLAAGALSGAEQGNANITEPSERELLGLQPRWMQQHMQQQLDSLSDGAAAGQASSAGGMAADQGTSDPRVAVAAMQAEPSAAQPTAAIDTAFDAAAAAHLAAAEAAPAAPAPAPAPTPAGVVVAAAAAAPRDTLIEVPSSKGVQVAHITPRPLAGPSSRPPATAASVRSWPLCPTAAVSSSSSWALQPSGDVAGQKQQQQQLVVITEESWVADLLAEGGVAAGGVVTAGGTGAASAIASAEAVPADAAADAEAVAATAEEELVWSEQEGPTSAAVSQPRPCTDAGVHSSSDGSPPNSTAGPHEAAELHEAAAATAAGEVCAAEVTAAAAPGSAATDATAAAPPPPAAAAPGSEQGGTQVSSPGVSYHGPWAAGSRPAGAGAADSNSRSWGGGMSAGSISQGSVGPGWSLSFEEEKSEGVEGEGSEGLSEEDQALSQIEGGGDESKQEWSLEGSEEQQQQQQMGVRGVVYSAEGESDSGSEEGRAQEGLPAGQICLHHQQQRHVQQQQQQRHVLLQQQQRHVLQQGAGASVAKQKRSRSGRQKLVQVGPQGVGADGRSVLQQGRDASAHTAVAARPPKRQRKGTAPGRAHGTLAVDVPQPQQQLPDSEGADDADGSDGSPVATAEHGQQQGGGSSRRRIVAAAREQQQQDAKQQRSRKRKGGAQQGSQRALRALAVQQHLLHKPVGRKFLRHMAYRM